MMLALNQIQGAVRALAKSERGLGVLRDFLAFLDDSAAQGLDHTGKEALLLLLEAAFGPSSWSTREYIRNALPPDVLEEYDRQRR